jgi:hypothetical protein
LCVRAALLVPAAHPQQALEIDAGGGGRLRLERIGDIDPGNDMAGACGRCRCGQREGRASGAGEPCDLGYGAYRQSATALVEGVDSGRQIVSVQPGRGSQGRGDALGELLLDYGPEVSGGMRSGAEWQGGRHDLRLIFAFWSSLPQSRLHYDRCSFCGKFNIF